MALTVETGEGSATSDTFVSLADFRSYWDARGATEPTSATDAAAEAALRQAADYLGLAYRWSGRPTNSDQALCWPRYGVYDPVGTLIEDDAIPVVVIRAQMILAFQALSQSLLTTEESASTAGAVIEQEVKVGSIATRTKYEPGTTSATSGLPTFAAVDALLADYVANRASSFQQVRLVRS